MSVETVGVVGEMENANEKGKMKKVTLLNFPFQYYEPIRKTSEMLETFKLIKDKKQEEKENKLKQLQDEKLKYEEELRQIPVPPENFRADPAVVKWEARCQELNEQYPYNRWALLGTLGEKLKEEHWKARPEVLRNADRIEHKTSHIKWITRDIEKLMALINQQIPMMPSSLKPKHIDLINREIHKRAQQGLELDSYQFVETEFFNDDNHCRSVIRGCCLRGS